MKRGGFQVLPHTYAFAPQAFLCGLLSARGRIQESFVSRDTAQPGENVGLPSSETSHVSPVDSCFKRYRVVVPPNFTFLIISKKFLLTNLILLYKIVDNLKISKRGGAK